MIPNARVLVFKAGGTVEIHDSVDNVLWKSSSVPAFTEEFGSFVSPEDDADVLTWLVQNETVSPDIADRLLIEVESVDTDEDEDEEDEEDDEDDY